MKFITCASYYGSGSSAITDLISEYSSVLSFTDEEFRFLQDPHGISDLEYYLVENFNRHNSGWALKQYKKLVDFYSGNFITKRYEKYFKGNWKNESYNYIDSLTLFTYHGWWMYDLLDKGKFYYFLKRFPNKILKTTVWRGKPDRALNMMKNEITYCSHPSEEEFLNYTKRYIEQLFASVNPENKILMVDQLFPSTNIKRFNRYFNDIKIFLVDRDPRDIFVLEKYVWKDGLIPTDPVLFCKWYKYTRYNKKKEVSDNINVKYIQFEDLIFKYGQIVPEIEKWVGLKEEDHTRSKKIFNPKESLQNTQTWLKYRCNINEIKYIEKELKDYLYDFSSTAKKNN